MGGLLPQGDKVPESVRVLKNKIKFENCPLLGEIRYLAVGDGVPLLGVDEAREEDRVPDEEDWGVVPDQVPVSLLGVELDGEPPGVAGGVGRSRLPPDGGEAGDDGGALPHLGEDVGLAVLGDVVGHLEVAKGARALGVHHALGDALPVEVRHLVDELGVLQEEGAAGADGLGVELVADGGAPGGGQTGAGLKRGGSYKK